MIVRRGVHRPLEDAADAIIKESLKGVTRHSDKSDILTPWKEQERRRREVYVPSGTPDAANRHGNFHRALNVKQSHLNSRGQGTSRGSRIGGAARVSEENWDDTLFTGGTQWPGIGNAPQWDSE